MMKPITCAWCQIYRPGQEPRVLGCCVTGGHGICEECKLAWLAESMQDPAVEAMRSPCCGWFGRLLPRQNFGYEWRQCSCGHIYIVRQPSKSS